MVRLIIIRIWVLVLIFGASGAQKAHGPPENALDGKSFDGSIRAKGVIGIVSVKGTLAFENGQLIWMVNGSKDIAPYQVDHVEGELVFSAQAPAENGEFVNWSGTFDGETIHNVTAKWTRVEGDIIHDLFLPDVVTMVFTPKK